MAKDIALELRGQKILLLPERVVFWENRSTLVVADVHLGKAASFREFAIPVPGGITSDDLARLNRVIQRTQTHRLIILGDLLHAKAGRTAQTMAEVHSWRASHPELEILHIRGNHDGGAGDPPAEWQITSRDEPFYENPFVLRHHPSLSPAGYTLAGHFHPAVTLRGVGGQRERLPCFLFGKGLALLPAFGSFTGSATVSAGPDDRVYVVAGDEVLMVKNQKPPF